MKKHIVKVLKTGFITPAVKRLVVEKPQGYQFIPGQATAISMHQPKYNGEERSFSFVSLNESDELEFCLKNYTGHDGFAEKLLMVKTGDELALQEPFGTIRYKGPGVFIAGGNGVTPFIAIFRQLEADSQLQGNTLLFGNRTAEDIIWKDELKEMLGENCVHVLETSHDPAIKNGFIGSKLLEQYKTDDKGFYYICGPDKFTIIIVRHLLKLGVAPSQLVFEKEQIRPSVRYQLIHDMIQFI